MCSVVKPRAVHIIRYRGRCRDGNNATYCNSGNVFFGGGGGPRVIRSDQRNLTADARDVSLLHSVQLVMGMFLHRASSYTCFHGVLPN
jgi:hypothetical protein